MKKYIEENFETIKQDFENLKSQTNSIEKVTQILIETFQKGNKVLFCGNGGSASDCEHMSAELVGKFKAKKNLLSAISVCSNTSILTSISNDFDYSEIFSTQIEALGKKEDVLFAISTSAKSKNIVKALKKAKEKGLITIGLFGQNDNDCEGLCDYKINAPSKSTPNIQQMHLAIEHLICEIIENKTSQK